MITYLAQSSHQTPIDWGVVAAFLVPLITAMSILFGAAGWFVKTQIRLVTAAMESRLLVLERAQSDQAKAQADMSKALMDLGMTTARIEGKISSGASMQTPSA